MNTCIVNDIYKTENKISSVFTIYRVQTRFFFAYKGLWTLVQRATLC
jgi:hypothetical protein